MKRATPFTGLLLILLSITMIVSSCVQGSAKRSSGKTSNNNQLTGNSSGSSNAVDSTTTTDSTVTTQRVELSHLVDPFDGTYKKKLTIPKNFKGNLYLAGLNVSALVNKIVYVRFYFGTDKQPVTLNATVARAPGIVPKTDIQVLVVDMNSRPFNKMSLSYDLYDYNDYSDATKEIVTDPKDNNVYCRGLKLEDDPTFIPVSQSSTCADTGKCLYSYAKIVDSTLYYNQVVNGSTYLLSSVPTNPQIWTESSGVRTPTIGTFASTVCLPDDPLSASSFNQLFNLTLPAMASGPVTGLSGYSYYGPYRSIDDGNWQITGSAAIYSANGIFNTQSAVTSATTGYNSNLFPRAGKLSLGVGVSYLGSSINKIGSRGAMVSDSTGTTQYVDGCNFRVQNYDSASNEGIGSCNVDSSIQVFYKDANNNEVTITTDKTIKLQLIRPSSTNSEGKEVLATAFKHCSASSACGSDECCFNQRCWSKDLVTQCVDQTVGVGNEEVGSTCTSDYECASLCCNQSTGSCAPHDPNGSTPIFCSKASGQSCVSQEFCAQTAVTTCKIVKTGTLNGVATCALRCPSVMTYGTCTAGVCVPPTQPAIPAFDPTDCSQAVDP